MPSLANDLQGVGLGCVLLHSFRDNVSLSPGPGRRRVEAATEESHLSRVTGNEQKGSSLLPSRPWGREEEKAASEMLKPPAFLCAILLF